MAFDMPVSPSTQAVPGTMIPAGTPFRVADALRVAWQFVAFLLRRTKHQLPPLVPVQHIKRPVSSPEYYHASVGASGKTLEPPRENAFCIEAAGQLPAERWQQALEQVTAWNPGTRLRMIGDGLRAHWTSDGLPPRLRIVENCHWDGRSDQGADFLYQTPLSLTDGPTVELIVAPQPGNRSLVVLRNHHAVMDGMGNMHFLHELFRALRGEPLEGTNAAFSDVDVMLSVGAPRSTSRHIKTTALTGLPQGDERGDEWRRITLGKPRKNSMAKVAGAVASFAHMHSDLPALIMVPVELRRHAAGLQSTACYTTALMVRLEKGEGGNEFKERLGAMISEKMETAYPRILEFTRCIPLSRLDRLLSRTEANYRTKKALETVVISNIGGCHSTRLSCEGFETERMFVIPLKGSAFMTMICVDTHMELALNLPRVLASNGRFDAFVEHLLKTMDER